MLPHITAVDVDRLALCSRPVPHCAFRYGPAIQPGQGTAVLERRGGCVIAETPWAESGCSKASAIA